MKAFLTDRGVYLEDEGGAHRTDLEWDELFTAPDAFALAESALRAAAKGDLGGTVVGDLREGVVGELPGGELSDLREGNPGDLPRLAAPIGRQEVWAAGVTYTRSRTARMSESEKAGGGSFYDRVYTAERPELFFKGMRSRVCGHREAVRIRSDSAWSVPEPELALAVSSTGRIIGFTIGNDMSARDIEGENPLYLPQAKVYRGGCALGPGLLLSPDPLPDDTEIRLTISRDGQAIVEDAVHISRMKRTPKELVEYLFRDNVFSDGCYLLTGTGIVPPDEFTLHTGDEISITIGPIGTLVNRVE